MIEVKNMSIRIGDFQLHDINFTVPTGQYCILMGPTACGKTTVLETICGLKQIQQGQVFLHGYDVTHTKPALRNIGFVPQDGALFTHMSVFDNIAFSLNIAKIPQDDIRARVETLAEMMSITHLLQRHCVGLSGGERQRVALGRALASNPSILCLDEPLSALDDETHGDICDLLKSVHKQTDVTTLHITHSMSETKRLADLCLTFNKHGQISKRSNA